VNDLQLHHIGIDAIPAALKKARQYRSLLEPEQAESICLDILEVQPDNHEARILLILVLTDQFSHSGKPLNVKHVLELIGDLPDEYERLYYTGLVSERRARALLHESMSRSFSYGYFREALRWYEQAEKIRPAHNDDAILRWNACLRTLRRERLQPRPDRDEAQTEMES
jgi:tetratricopeptide (TPR) repeat protein